MTRYSKRLIGPHRKHAEVSAVSFSTEFGFHDRSRSKLEFQTDWQQFALSFLIPVVVANELARGRNCP